MLPEALTGDIIEAGAVEHLGVFTETCAAQEVQARAGSEVRFVNFVENKSNGVARFCLDYVAFNQSTVRFESATAGFVIDNQGCFTLDTVDDPASGYWNSNPYRAAASLDPLFTPLDSFAVPGLEAPQLEARGAVRVVRQGRRPGGAASGKPHSQPCSGSSAGKSAVWAAHCRRVWQRTPHREAGCRPRGTPGSRGDRPTGAG